MLAIQPIRAPIQPSTPHPVAATARPLRPQRLDSFAPAAPDARAYLAKAVEDIRARTARGERVRVVFDLDDTVWDTRPRTLELGRRWDAEHGTDAFSGLTVREVGKNGWATAKRAGLSDDDAKAFDRFWKSKIYTDELAKFDQPFVEIVELARNAAAAGADVRYLTARVNRQRAITLEGLRRMRLPNADDAHLTMKPSDRVRSAEYKVNELTKWLDAGDTHYSWFMTESRRDVAAVQRAGLEIPSVLLDSPKERNGEAVDPSTPVYPAQFT